MSLENEIAVVTGASRGIGREIALEIGLQGACVVGTATTDEGTVKIEKMFKDRNIKGYGIALDVARNESIEAFFASVEAKVGAPTILVNNAGITRDGLLIRMSEEDWGAIIETNLTSVYRMCKTCLRPMMKARKGRIINIVSVVASTGNPGQTNYAAAKAGVAGFTRSLAREVGSRNITVNTVAPGFIDTDMTRDLPEAQRQAMMAQIPLGRFGNPEDIAHAVTFLASPKAGYITGTTLHVNGGMHMN